MLLRMSAALRASSERVTELAPTMKPPPQRTGPRS
jgi:hypothetical protein